MVYLIFLYPAQAAMNIEKLKLKEIVDKRVVDIGGTESVSQIPGTPEQQFLLFVRRKLPRGSKIIYEPQRFEIEFSDGTITSTAPDWRITKPSGQIIFTEMTLAKDLSKQVDKKSGKRKGKDPKERQRWVMSHFPDRHYVVLYDNNCRSIEKHNSHISFRHSKKIRR